MGFPVHKSTWNASFTANLNPALGCAFQGIGGQVFDLDNQPLQGIVISATSTNGFHQTAQSGSASPMYGQAGFLVQVNTAPSFSTYTVEVTWHLH